MSRKIILAIVCLTFMTIGTVDARAEVSAQVWITTQDLTKKLRADVPVTFAKGPPAVDQDEQAAGTIRVDPESTHQVMFGLGSSLEHSTCYNLSRSTSNSGKKSSLGSSIAKQESA